MSKFPLQYYQRLGGRLRWTLFFLSITFFALILYDLVVPTFGRVNVFLAVALASSLVLLFYYTVLISRGTVQIRTKHLRLQGPLRGVNVSYGRIRSVVSTSLNSYHPFDQLKSSERSVLKPLYGKTCIFIEMNGFPSSFKRRRLWFPRILFGKAQSGILVQVEDWMELTQRIESELIRYRHGRDGRSRQARTLVGRILAEDS
jgi:hypothetical protein